jgi:phage gp37-like protein
MRATEFIVEGVTEGKLNEIRDQLWTWVQSKFPRTQWPEYVQRDFLYQQAKGIRNQAELDDFLKRNRNDFGKVQWRLEKLPITMDIFTPKTQRMILSREGGSSNPFQVPRDAERHSQQLKMIQQKGVSEEPIIVAKLSNGYDLIEGWHRTIQHLKEFPQGYTAPAWVGYGATYTSESIKQGVAEGKLVESAIFLNPNTVIVGQQHGQPLKLSPNTLKQIQAIAAKHGAWYEGNGTDRGYTKGQIDRYVGSWDDEVAKTANSNDPKWIYVLFANVDENNRVQRVGIDPNNTIFNRLLDTAKDNSFQGIGYTSQALQKFLQMTSEGKYDFLKMSQQPATQENLTHFLKAGEALMWPNNWEQYPNKAGKIAKAATVDVRDQYLATRKAGVYVTGSGHLKAVQNITGKQGVTEGNFDSFKFGKPITFTAYHSSDSKIKRILPTDEFYFSDDRYTWEGNYLYKIKITLKNPYVVLDQKAGYEGHASDSLPKIKAAGYDGVIYTPYSVDYGFRQGVCFYPQQQISNIKLVNSDSGK